MNHRLAILAAAVLLWTGCRSTVRVTQEMVWRCAPEFRDASHPDVDPVTLTYAEEPDCFDLISGRGLCRELDAYGKKTLRVEFEAWGNRISGLQGYRIAAVEGRPGLYVVGMLGGSGRKGPAGACPMDRLFR